MEKELKKETLKEKMKKHFIAIWTIGCVMFATILIIGVVIIRKSQPMSFTEGNIEPEPTVKYAQANLYNGEEVKNGENSKESQETIEFPGYTDIVITEETENLPMINYETNTVYIDYVFYIDGKELVRTDLIAPGQVVNLDMKKYLDKGVHETTLIGYTYEVTDPKIACNSVEFNTKITIK